MNIYFQGCLFGQSRTLGFHLRTLPSQGASFHNRGCAVKQVALHIVAPTFLGAYIQERERERECVCVC